MKQHITTEDLNQLSEKGEKRLREWWKPEEGDAILISKGIRYGDGYGSWAKDRTKENRTFYIGNISIGDGSGSEERYKGDVKFPAFLESEYLDDNTFEYPIDKCLPLLSIGQMIEFLDEKVEKDKCITQWYFTENGLTRTDGIDVRDKDFQHFYYRIGKDDYNWCDALWEAVKEKLEK